MQTLSYKGEKCTGGKRSKDRVTAMVACNQDGSDKLLLLVIGKYARPHCLRNKHGLTTSTVQVPEKCMDG